VRENAVDADGEKPEPRLFNVLVPGPKLGQLGLSTGCEVEDVKENDRRRVLLERIREVKLLAARAGHLEIRCFLTYFEHLRQ
jgi:hypothetical protein